MGVASGVAGGYGGGGRCVVPGGLAELAAITGETVESIAAQLREGQRLGLIQFPHGIPANPTSRLVGQLTVPEGAGGVK